MRLLRGGGGDDCDGRNADDGGEMQFLRVRAPASRRAMAV